MADRRLGIGWRFGIVALVQAVLVSAPAGVEAGDPRADQEYAFVLTTDYFSAAYYSTIEVDPPRGAEIDIGTVWTDAVAHYDYGEDMVFVVNRYGQEGNNIQVVDPNQDFETIGQHSVGEASNPHDIRLTASDKAYVSRFEWKTLLIMNPYTGAHLDSIDLSVLADADGIPEMDRMELVDGKLFVTLANIDHVTWLPVGPGKVAVIDVAADTLIDVDPGTPGVQPITLECPNPYTELRYDPNRRELVVGCLGSWGVLDGGVETVDPFTLESKGVVISETDLGGDVYDALISTSLGKGYAVVMDPAPWPDNYARLVSFDLLTGQVADTVFAQTSGLGSSMATVELNARQELYLCDRDGTQPGVRIYDAVADTLIELIDVGLPPYDVAFVQPPPFLEVAAGDAPPMYADAVLDPNYPNPFNPETVIPFRLAEDAWVSMDVYDVQGRKVASLLDAWFPTGAHFARWPGRNDLGVELPAGVFFCRMRAGDETATRKLILVR